MSKNHLATMNSTPSKADIDVDSEEFDTKVEKSQRSWATTSDRTVFWPTSDVVDTIHPGLFRVVLSDKHGIMFNKMIVSTDELIRIKDSNTASVLTEINRFWEKTIVTEYTKRGLLHKRGIMMYGDPGSGKTSVIHMLITDLIDNGGLALICDDPKTLSSGLQIVRRIEPDRPIVVVLEDFETLTEQKHNENEWLSMMDGEAQIDNVVFLATTNYIERLDKRFTDRPSRFDMIVPVAMPSAIVRAEFLHAKEPDLSIEDLQYWVEQTENFSIAHIKELIISVCIWGRKLDTEIDRLKKMRDRKFSNSEFSEKSQNKLGFTVSSNELNSDEMIDWDAFAKRHGINED